MATNAPRQVPPPRRRWPFPVLMLAVVVALATWTLRTPPGAAPQGVVFQLIDGRRIALDDLRGRPVLVSFWATTCPACLREIPHLKALYREAAPQGLVMVAVAMPYDPPSEVLAMVADRELPYDVAVDVQGRVLRAFGRVPGTPTHFLMNGAGDIVLHHVGPLDTRRVLEVVTAGG